jgi:hypothetical protein
VLHYLNSEVHFLNELNGLTIGKTVLLPIEIVRAERAGRFVCLVAQYKPNIRNVLFAELNLATWEQLKAHLQVVVRVEERVVDGDRVHRDV